MRERRQTSWVSAVAALAVLLAAPAALAATLYKYDAQGRLISVVYDSGKRIDYHYDGAGNRTSVVSTATTGNLPPVANTNPVTLSVDEGSGATGVTSPETKFTDPNGDTRTVGGVTQGAKGVVAFTSTTLTYDVNSGVSGPSTDSFAYSVKDPSGAYGTTVVVVTINNLPPNAADDPSVSVNKNSYVDFNVFANDSDPGGDTFRITSLSNPPHGDVLNLAPGMIRYFPDANYTGTDTFTYTVTDEDGATDSATVTVTVASVNNPPEANDDSISVATNTPRTIDPRINDTDADSNPITVTGSTNGAHGTVTFTSASVTFTPTTSYTGSDAFTYTISDGAGGTDTANVIVLVLANVAPDAVNDSKSALLNTAATFDPRTNDTDTENGALVVTAVSTPSHGSATFTANSITYTPTTGYTGADSFTYTIQDNVGASDTATVSMTVTGANSAPDAVDDDLEATGVIGGVASGSVDVLANDTDPESQTLSITGTTNGTKGTTGFVGGVITYTTNGTTQTGLDTFTYTISDGHGGTDTATVHVSISRE